MKFINEKAAFNRNNNDYQKDNQIKCDYNINMGIHFTLLNKIYIFLMTFFKYYTF